MLDFNNAFGQADKAFEGAIHTTLNKLKSREIEGRMTLHEPAPRRKPRRLVAIALATVLTVAITTVALAASGVINLDLGGFYNSIFKNEKATPYVRTHERITMISNEGDVTIEPLAAFYDSISKTIYIHMLIHDPVGERLTDLFFFSEHQRIIDSPEIIGNVIDANTASVVFPRHFDQSAEYRDGLFKDVNDETFILYNGDLTFQLDMIGTKETPPSTGFTIFEGNWEFTISNVHKVIEREFSGEFDGHITQASLSALNLKVTVHNIYAREHDELEWDFPYTRELHSSATVLLKDGSVLRTTYNGAGYTSGVNQTDFSYSLDSFINPDDVVSITFFGSILE